MAAALFKWIISVSGGLVRRAGHQDLHNLKDISKAAPQFQLCQDAFGLIDICDVITVGVLVLLEARSPSKRTGEPACPAF